MANSNEGQDHKDKYFDTSRKILGQEMTMCNMEVFRSYDQCNFFFKLVKCQDQKIKFLQKDLITRDIHVKYQSSITHVHYSNVISKGKIFKKWVKLQGQVHRVKNNGTHENKVLSQGILKWNIKALAPTVQKL